jgi:hypothetical protein
MTDLNFFLADEPAQDNPDYDETGCQCPPGDNNYLLELEEGQAVLVHATCGLRPPANWGDWNEVVSMAPIPVTVEWEPECDGSTWHGLTACDHGAYIVVTATSVPEDVRAQALEASHQHAVNRNGR